MLHSIATKLRGAKNWLLGTAEDQPGPSKPRRDAHRQRLAVQTLEERVVPTIGFVPGFNGTEIVSGEGSAYTTANIYLLFEGGASSYWTTTQGKADLATLTSDIKTIINSTYLQGISQYAQTSALYNNVQDNFITSYTDTTDTLPANFMGSNAHVSWTALNTLLADAEGTPSSGIVAPAAATPENFYVFITDPKIASGIGPNAAGITVPGYNTHIQPGGGNGYNEIWFNTQLNSAKTALNMNLATTFFSEELADTQSGKVQVQYGNSVSAWIGGYGNYANSQSQQLADGEESMMSYTSTLNGVTVAAYWSQQDQEFIIPNGTTKWTYPTATIVTSLSNYELLSNGIMLEKTSINGTWTPALSGIQSIGQGASGSTWANTVYALDDFGNLYFATAGQGVFTLEHTNVQQFAFGNKGTSYVNEAFLLYNLNVGYNLDVSNSPSTAFTLLDANIQSFMLGPVGSIWQNFLFCLHYGTTGNQDDFTLYASETNLTLYKMDNHVAEIGFGASGSTWANTFIDLHNAFDPTNPDTLWASTNASTFYSSRGTSLVKFEAGVAGFSFGNAGTSFVNSFVIYFNNGNLDYDAAGGKLTVIDTGVTSYSFGQAGTSWAGTLYYVDQNGIWENTSPASTSKPTLILSSPYSGYGTGGVIAFGLLGTGNGNTVYFLDQDTGSFYDSLVSGSSGPNTGVNPMFLNVNEGQYGFSLEGWDTEYITGTPFYTYISWVSGNNDFI